ncbi:DUF4326 domain-containing protein [Streptomyces lonarensis]|uniref:DUF4326 domain-containing protein n=1 Tax=Streptomyces lonarensis TaxID=700599 RepID=A0A7X6HWZ0_9ACTN|nr:DUF4326 domain-containing protein [Streptomyces lonarensis]NJQ04051.1 DUF4326 domain-containing protein [Streptomyces lonarensis]
MPVRLRGVPSDAAALSTTCAYVGPRSPYANPYVAGARSPLGPPMKAEESVDLFEATLRGSVGRHYSTQFARALRGLDLMCTCPLDAPCHADVLLRLANSLGDGTAPRTTELLEDPR